MSQTATFPTALPTSIITFLFTDIEGSTTLWEQYPDAMRQAVARHDVLLRQAVADNGGVVFKTTGDGILAAFTIASDGVAAALAAQQALLAELWPPETIIRSRMGLHTGMAELRDDDYFGSTLNRTARLMSAGHGGQTLLSSTAYELCRDNLPHQASLLPLGEHRLKDLSRPETIYQLLHPVLPADFPPLRTLDNHMLPNNLPQQVTSFVGREKEIGQVKEFLSKTRLLTLAAAGGSGKTRLGLQVAADVLDNYPDGAWLVELASLADSVLVPQTVATVLGVKEQPGQTRQSITHTLIEQLGSKRLLVVLDNCEHLIQACATLVAALLRGCSNITVLATSREPLGIAGEAIYRVPPLSLPDPRQNKRATRASVSQFEAVRLFIDRSQAVKSDFVVTNGNASAVAQICWRLDGIPLALELAAARVRSLPVEQMVGKLDSRFRLLTGGDRSALPRQQTLRALIDWSYDLLTEQEKTLLARLSIFAGGWTLDAAEAVCGWDPIEDWEVLDLITSLSDKSLVLAEEQDGGGASRYRILESIRQYAQERLVASGNATNVKVRHSDFFVAFGLEAASYLTGPEQARWLNCLESEHENLRAALDCCATQASDVSDAAEASVAALSGLRLSAALIRFWWVRGYWGEGREQVARALTAPTVAGSSDPAIKRATAEALRAEGTLANSQGEDLAARSLYQESLRLYREIGDTTGIARALGSLGIVASGQGDHAAAQLLYEECLQLYREVGNKGGIAVTLMCLGNVASVQGDYASMRSLYEECLSLYREIGDKNSIANSLSNLGIVASGQDDHVAARSFYEECLQLYREVGNKGGIASTLNHLGMVAFRQDEYSAARSLYEESLRLYREIGDMKGLARGFDGMADICAHESNVRWAILLRAGAAALRESIGVQLSSTERAKQEAVAREELASMDDDTFAAAWAEGAALSWEETVDLALRHE